MQKSRPSQRFVEGSVEFFVIVPLQSRLVFSHFSCAGCAWCQFSLRAVGIADTYREVFSFILLHHLSDVRGVGLSLDFVCCGRKY